jgi:hypothetical protein
MCIIGSNTRLRLIHDGDAFFVVIEDWFFLDLNIFKQSVSMRLCLVPTLTYIHCPLLCYSSAKESAGKTYNPILLGTNVVYLLLLLGSRQSLTLWRGLLMAITWGLQGYAYLGIMDNAANAIRSIKDSALVGGAHLDLLALTWLVQFGSVLLTSKLYWLLCIVPPWGGWTLYKTFKGGPANQKGNANTADPNGAAAETDPKLADKRKKRAEKRQQKWS